MTLYIVSAEKASVATNGLKMDKANGVFVIANSQFEAEELAEDFFAGIRDTQGMTWSGRTIFVVIR